MLKILIVEDNSLFAQDLKDMLADKPCKVVGIANKYTEAVQMFDTMKPDFVFIDIELKGQETGIDFANYMNAKARVPFIYLTRFYGSKYQEYFNKANDTNHYNFLTKLKVDKEDIWHHIEVAMDKFIKENNLLIEGFEKSYVLRGFIYLKSKQYNKYEQIPVNSIIYLEMGRPYLSIYTSNGTYQIRKSLTQMIDFLQCPYIVQINAKHAVNIHHVKDFSLTESEVSVEVNTTFAVGRKYKEPLLQVLPAPTVK